MAMKHVVPISLAAVLLFFAHPGLSQSSTTTTSGSSDQIRDSSVATRPTDNDTGPEPDAPKTVYSKSGTEEAPAANPYGKAERRGRITFGKKTETMITTDSKPVILRKTKDGSSDTTVPTGVFKESLLDVAVDGPLTLVPQQPETKAEAKAAASASPQPEAQPSVSPKPNAVAKEVEAPQLDLSLGVTTPRPVREQRP
jgi:hypothetical protein